ncbi:MCE family protein [Mycolicibacterium sp. XJ1819]
MKSFAERNPLILCAIGIVLTISMTAVALNYDKIPLVNQDKQYTAYFEDAGGLTAGAPVEISGFRVGKVESLGLDDGRVIVGFNVDNDIRLGDKTEAAINTKTLLGAKLLKVTPRGDGHQAGPIPIERTRSPYQLPDALGDLASTISGLDTQQLSHSLAVLSNTFKDTPSSLKRAVDGVGRLADTLDRRDAQLRNLLANADKVSAVLAEDSDNIVTLVTATNALLESLQREGRALDAISNHIAGATNQLQGLIADNRDTLKPALDKLNGVLVILDTHKQQIQESIKLLNAYAMSLGEATSSGPFFKSYLANLLPGQFVQPFVDAAFSDLGLDPNTLLPSQLTDPQVGQPATPPLPIPYPRTGQGGEPILSLPDAITGKPGDPRYPSRPPLPAPPPGGPPPGPPALPPPHPASASETAPASSAVPTPEGDS